MLSRKIVPLILVLAGLAIAACTRPVSPPGVTETNDIDTQATVEALTPTVTDSPSPTTTPTATTGPTATATATPDPIFVDLPLDHPAREMLESAYKQDYLEACQEDPLMVCPDDPVTILELVIAAVRLIEPDFDPNAEPSAGLLTPIPQSMNITYVYLHTPGMRGFVPSEEAQGYVERFIELGLYTRELQCNTQYPSIFCPDFPMKQNQAEELDEQMAQVPDELASDKRTCLAGMSKALAKLAGVLPNTILLCSSDADCPDGWCVEGVCCRCLHGTNNGSENGPSQCGNGPINWVDGCNPPPPPPPTNTPVPTNTPTPVPTNTPQPPPPPPPGNGGGDNNGGSSGQSGSSSSTSQEVDWFTRAEFAEWIWEMSFPDADT